MFFPTYLSKQAKKAKDHEGVVQKQPWSGMFPILRLDCTIKSETITIHHSTQAEKRRQKTKTE